MSRTVKKLLVSFILIGALASITTGGTYAILQSDTTNGVNTISSGTLKMTNLFNATTCDSSTGQNTMNGVVGNSVSSSCATLVTAGTEQYPGTVQTYDVTLSNTGNLPGYALGLSMPGGCAESASIVSGAVIGGGHPCGATGDLFYVQETNSTFTTMVHCWYPAGGTTCSIGGGGTLNNFSSNYGFNGTSGSKLNLSSDGTTSPATQYAFQAGTSRYFIIGIEEGTDNTLQGETATFSLLWHLDSGP